MDEEKSKLTKPIMAHGVGMPYVAIFNIDGYPILDPYTQLPIGSGTTRFTFRSKIEEANETEITIQTGRSDIADSPQLQEGILIVVQWGYIFPNGSVSSSKPKVVRIKDIDYTFDTTGTTVILKCSDDSKSLQYLPQYVPDPEKDRTFTEFMDEGLHQQIGIIIKRFKDNEEQ